MEPTSSNLEENLTPRGAMLYRTSTLHCMTQSLALGGAGLGAAWGRERAEAMAEEAGFGSFEPLEGSRTRSRLSICSLVTETGANACAGRFDRARNRPVSLRDGKLGGRSWRRYRASALDHVDPDPHELPGLGVGALGSDVVGVGRMNPNRLALWKLSAASQA